MRSSGMAFQAMCLHGLEARDFPESMGKMPMQTHGLEGHATSEER